MENDQIWVKNHENFDLKKSILIGDRLSDLQAGLRSDIKKIFHVLTGHGLEERNGIIHKSLDYNYKESYKLDELILNEKDKSSKIYLIDNLKEFPMNFLEKKDG